MIRHKQITDRDLDQSRELSVVTVYEQLSHNQHFTDCAFPELLMQSFYLNDLYLKWSWNKYCYTILQQLFHCLLLSNSQLSQSMTVMLYEHLAPDLRRFNFLEHSLQKTVTKILLRFIVCYIENIFNTYLNLRDSPLD